MEGYFADNMFLKGRLIDAKGNCVCGTFSNQKITGTAELKSNALSYQGDFKDGEISGKGTFTWPKDGLQLKFAGQTQNQIFG